MIGSFGWGGKLVEKITELFGNLKLEFIEPVLIKGKPKEKDFEKLDKLAESIIAKYKEENLI